MDQDGSEDVLRDHRLHYGTFDVPEEPSRVVLLLRYYNVAVAVYDVTVKLIVFTRLLAILALRSRKS